MKSIYDMEWNAEYDAKCQIAVNKTSFVITHSCDLSGAVKQNDGVMNLAHHRSGQ